MTLSDEEIYTTAEQDIRWRAVDAASKYLAVSAPGPDVLFGLADRIAEYIAGEFTSAWQPAPKPTPVLVPHGKIFVQRVNADDGPRRQDGFIISLCAPGTTWWLRPDGTWSEPTPEGADWPKYAIVALQGRRTVSDLPSRADLIHPDATLA